MRASKAQKLTAGIVRHLRKLNEEGHGVNAADAGRMYGVSAETIRRALRYETWTETGRDATEEENAVAAGESLKKLQTLLAKQIETQPDKTLEEISRDATPEELKALEMGAPLLPGVRIPKSLPE